MKIIQTATLLIFTLLFVPIFSYYFGTALGEKEIYTIKLLTYVTITSIAFCFIVGEITQNNSQVDKLWSILPIIYTWIMAHQGGYSPKLILMAILVTMWGIRLTYNFSLKGAYKLKFWEGEEDYRWQVLRNKKEFQPKWKWTLFNLFFICIYQNILILLFTLPMLIVLQSDNHDVSRYDLLITLLMVGFIIYEAIADAQHWTYQSKKWSLIKEGKELEGDYKKGFLDAGLWAWSRHPNYFAEQMIWITFYFFSVVATYQWINWSILGALLLVLLFQGSANFGEEISAGKYPLYKEYQAKVGRFIPFLK